MAPSRLPPSAVQKECQRVIHFIAHNEVFKMEDLNDEQKKNKMFTLVHGDTTDDDQLSLNALFLGGKQQFAHAFDRETINVTDDDASTNEILVLKEVLHRQKNMKFVVGDDITERLVSSSTLKGTNLVEGRTIKNNSELAKRNALKCIAYAKVWMKGKNVLPSGQSWDDMYEHVFSQMEQNIKGGEEKADKVTGDDATSINACQIQSGLFPGWMVFVLYGPYGPEPRYHIEWIQESPDSKMGPGRKEARRIKLEKEDKKPMKHNSSWANEMISFDQRVMAAAIVQREESDAGRRYDNDLMCLQLQVSNLMKEKSLHLRLMEIKGGTKSESYDDDLLIMKELDVKVKQVNAAMQQMRESSKKRKQNPLIRDFIDLVSRSAPGLTSIQGSANSTLFVSTPESSRSARQTELRGSPIISVSTLTADEESMVASLHGSSPNEDSQRKKIKEK